MQAIQTTALAPTNTLGLRIRARCDGATIVLPWWHSVDTLGNHRRAASALASRLGWDLSCDLVSGSLPANRGMAHVLVERKKRSKK